jgi:outer membrane receptor protein involved in Fe transport
VSNARTKHTPAIAAFLVVVVSGLAIASPARADVRTEARTHFRRGMALIADGDIDAGVSELQEAYDILPHPNVLYNIARAYAEAGRYDEGIEYFDRYLETDPADRDEVLAFLAALRSRIEAQQQRAVAAATPTTEPDVEEPTVTAPLATAEEIQALEDSATQIAALAEATQSDALRQRAERLRVLAESLRERRTASEGTEGTDATREQVTDASGETTQGSDALGEGEGVSGADEGDGLALGEGRQGDTYEESVVSSSRAAQSPLDAPNSTTTITAQDIRLSGMQNPGYVLRRVAGVSYLQSGPADPQISIRGLNQRLSNRVVVLVDGRSMYFDFLGTTYYQLLPINMEDIERIEVIRGPASALYGADAMTGVVNIITRPLGDGRSYITGGFGTGNQIVVQTGVYARADRFRFRVSGGYHRADQFALEIAPERRDITPAGDDPNLAHERLYFNGEVSYRMDGGYMLRAGSAVLNGEVTFQGVSRLRQIRARDATFAQTFASFETPWGLSSRVFWNRLNVLVELNGQIPGGIPLTQSVPVDRSDVVDAEVVYRNNFDLFGIQNQFIGGVAYRFKEVDWSWIDDGLQTQHHGAVFLQDTLLFSDVLQIVLSVRGDLHPLAGPQVSPRGSIVIHPSTGQTIRLTGGTAFRSPTFVESYLQIPVATPLRGVTAFGVGNRSLNPERLISIELGYMNQMTEYFALEVNGYYNVVLDQILLSRNSPYRLHDFGPGGSNRARYVEEFEGYPLGELSWGNEAEQFQQIGGEIGLRVFPVQGLDVYANYAIHETSHFAGPLGNLSTDQRTSAHMVNAGIQYRSSFGLDLSADFSWQSDQVWIEQEVDTERGGAAFRRFALRGYFMLNARIGWRLLDDQLELAVIGTNLIDEGHREHPFGQPVDRRFMGTVTVRF